MSSVKRVYSERRKPLKSKDFRRFSMPICRLFVTKIYKPTLKDI